MSPLERAAKLKHEAGLLLQEIQLADSLRSFGRLIPTGSYFLDVMVYPDLDLYLSPVSVAQLFQLGAHLASFEKVYEVVFQKSRRADLPGGLYLKARVEYGDWGHPWKIDIWSLADTLIAAKMQEMQGFKERMTAHLREQIITYKFSIMTEQQRTPMFSGLHVYRAFIDEGLSDFGEVSQYLLDHGIKMG
jgi:hypothetical protein